MLRRRNSFKRKEVYRMTYEKRITGVSHGFTKAYLEKRAKQDSEEEREREKEKIRLYLDLISIDY